MLKLSNAPEIEIEWGSQTPENRKKWIDWVFKNLNSIATNKNIKSDELKSFAQKLFEEINLCGYRTGYDSARCDYEEEEF